ncbi:MAG: DUF2797 domain-containing protein [Flavobacteriia bacterium]|nr:DUF2797 domain-containing protein [Flavobacteriia bacterium]OJX39195.1 MAG: hypothetical protein BGO87_04215 [Flavobacteriia bacterium 40-80]
MIQGTLNKMKVEQGEKIQYSLYLNDQLINMNERIGSSFTMELTGAIFCLKCNSRTKTSFNQGFCYKCFLSAPECSQCIIKPELCEAHLGKGRDPQWEQDHHNQPHYVYLAASDAVKVGVTRDTQVPTRWIDQGASSAIIFAETPNRYEAGKIEVALKSFFTDKTNWRNMLKNQVDDSIDLISEKWNLETQLPREITDFITDDEEVHTFNYPVLSYPGQVNSISLEKVIRFTKVLVGIKGQYLIFEDGSVINLRKYGGYQVIIG